MSTRSECNIRKLRRSGTGPSTGRRLRANWPAELRTNGEKADCTVMDVSKDGANLLVESPLTGDAPLWLIVENVGPIAAQLALPGGAAMGITMRFPSRPCWPGFCSYRTVARWYIPAIQRPETDSGARACTILPRWTALRSTHLSPPTIYGSSPMKPSRIRSNGALMRSATSGVEAIAGIEN